MRHYARNIGDLAAATRGLDLTHRGAYDALLDAYYLNERPLPLDHTECYALAGAFKPAERKAVDAVLARFFNQEPDGYHQTRCDRELAKWASKSAGARDAINLRWERERQARLGSERQETEDDEKRTNQSRNTSVDTNVLLPNTHYPVPTTQDATVRPASSLRSDASVPPLGANGAKRPRRSAGRPEAKEAKSAPTFAAYASAYFDRYGVEPVRNAKVNAHLCDLVDKLGSEEAPHVAAYFVRSSRGLYVSARHPANLLARDAESLRTEWATGDAMTETRARQADRTAATGNVFDKLRREVADGTHG